MLGLKTKIAAAAIGVIMPSALLAQDAGAGEKSADDCVKEVLAAVKSANIPALKNMGECKSGAMPCFNIHAEGKNLRITFHTNALDGGASITASVAYLASWHNEKGNPVYSRIVTKGFVPLKYTEIEMTSVFTDGALGAASKTEGWNDATPNQFNTLSRIATIGHQTASQCMPSSPKHQ